MMFDFQIYFNKSDLCHRRLRSSMKDVEVECYLYQR